MRLSGCAKRLVPVRVRACTYTRVQQCGRSVGVHRSVHLGYYGSEALCSREAGLEGKVGIAHSVVCVSSTRFMPTGILSWK